MKTAMQPVPDRDLLSAAHLKMLDDSNALLVADGLPACTVAEFLACRLEDATLKLYNVKAILKLSTVNHLPMAATVAALTTALERD